MLSVFQVDAFTDRLFGGNPAAVVPLEHWLPTEVMLSIAAENNLAETAFFVPIADGEYHLRWFTPEIEVPLCGHATLATAHILFRHLGEQSPEIVFHSASGPLIVTQNGDRLELNFPSEKLTPIEPINALVEGLRMRPVFTGMAKHYLLAELPDEDTVRSLEPDFVALAKVEALGVIVTSRGKQADFVSRFFAPNAGINEDPVTGSAHCVLVPYWAEKTGQKTFWALQVSKRGGSLWCTLEHERVRMSGHAVTYLQGTFSYE